MSWLKDDERERCGYGRFFSTDWVWKLLSNLSLTKWRKDPYINLCEWHDRMTDAEYAKKLKQLNIDISPERLQQGFDEGSEEIAEDTGYRKLGAFYRFVTKRFTRFFD